MLGVDGETELAFCKDVVRKFLRNLWVEDSCAVTEALWSTNSSTIRSLRNHSSNGNPNPTAMLCLFQSFRLKESLFIIRIHFPWESLKLSFLNANFRNSILGLLCSISELGHFILAFRMICKRQHIEPMLALRISDAILAGVSVLVSGRCFLSIKAMTLKAFFKRDMSNKVE